MLYYMEARAGAGVIVHHNLGGLEPRVGPEIGDGDGSGNLD